MITVEFRYTVSVVEDRSYGNEMADGSWNGIIGKIINKVVIQTKHDKSNSW